MAYLLIPGRHLCNTTFQERYLSRVLHRPPADLELLHPAPPEFTGKLDTILFAVTSANQANSRYNPIEFHVRAVGVDRFARHLRSGLPDTRFRIVGVPHFGPTERFARNTLRELEEQTEQDLRPSPRNTLVVCSTPAVIAQYAELGYGILPAELDAASLAAGAPKWLAPNPIDLVRRAAELGERWSNDPYLAEHLHPATRSLWLDYPQVPERVTRLYRDPLLNDEGSLTKERNYAVYAFAMSNPATIEAKYRDIADAIRPGKIVDEGCADAALLVPIARDFPDSDLVGIEITGEFMAQCRERQRRGDFGGTYVHFHQRNLMDDIFEENSIDITICNSTVHELWSYGRQADTLRPYLARKFRQTRRGGRIVVRDVVAPEDMAREVHLWLNDTDGSNADPLKMCPDADSLQKHLDGLSTAARFRRFARDFLAAERQGGHRSADTAVAYREETIDGRRYVVLSLKHAAEFLAKKDYTDSWDSEMHEEFTYWPLSTWRSELEAAGFRMLPNSRAYANAWIIDNRFKGKAELFRREGGSLVGMGYPVTNVVVVAEKG
jgi:ubiquinone/menaquinone biosynthesis C-methylase UbiE